MKNEKRHIRSVGRYGYLLIWRRQNVNRGVPEGKRLTNRAEVMAEVFFLIQQQFLF